MFVRLFYALILFGRSFIRSFIASLITPLIHLIVRSVYVAYWIYLLRSFISLSIPSFHSEINLFCSFIASVCFFIDLFERLDVGSIWKEVSTNSEKENSAHSVTVYKSGTTMKVETTQP